ncbi:MAG TPA: HEAT repeat domain-containing protein [Nitrospiraceae bacterium]|nr:HEAT repeat domain-containing protein [Nitrospiraceae bacterium]
MHALNQRGQANLTAILLFVGCLVAGVWVWKRLSPDTQDYVVEHLLPIALVALVAAVLLRGVIKTIRRRRETHRRLDRLLMEFEGEQAIEKRRELAFTAIETNGYRLEGLERVRPALVDLFLSTMKDAKGDKQHRIRGMAASYIGVLQDQRVIPALIAALEDDHAYVRACAALGLGRMRAAEAKTKLAEVMAEDWDQTVRSRAREALERMA